MKKKAKTKAAIIKTNDLPKLNFGQAIKTILKVKKPKQ